MECDVVGDDLLGEELKEKEFFGVSFVSSNLTKGDNHKRHISSRNGALSRSGAQSGVHIGARDGATLGMWNKKAAFLRRGSPMKRKASSSGFPLYGKNKSQRSNNKSSNKDTDDGLEGSKKTLIYHL